jgi:hypothetical protein
MNMSEKLNKMLGGRDVLISENRYISALLDIFFSEKSTRYPAKSPPWDDKSANCTVTSSVRSNMEMLCKKRLVFENDLEISQGDLRIRVYWISANVIELYETTQPMAASHFFASIAAIARFIEINLKFLVVL